MTSNQTGRGRPLDASGGRSVVFCHACHHEWYQDEFGLAACPRCGGEIVELVTLENDPRSLYLDDRPSRSLSRSPFAALSDFSDPEEADIDDHMPAGSGILLQERVLGSNRTDRGRRRSRTPHDHDYDHLHNHDHGHHHPHDHDHDHDHDHGHGHGRPGLNGNDAIFRQFSEMLTGFGIRNMHPDVITQVSTGPAIQRTTYTSNGGRFSSVTITATMGGGPSRPRPGSGIAGGEPLGIGPIFRELFGAMPMPSGMPGDRDDDHERGLPPVAMLLDLLSQGNARHGDAVYTQEALDRIITALMEANPQSNAAPPASEDALSRLTRQKVDEKLLGNEGGNIECTICIEELKVGDDVAHLPCKHWFHDQCVVMWLKEHNTCPICRHPIEENGSSQNSDSGNNAGGSNRASSRSAHQTGDQASGSRGSTRSQNPSFSINVSGPPRQSPGPSGGIGRSSSSMGGPGLGSSLGADLGTGISTRRGSQTDSSREGLRPLRPRRQPSDASPRDYQPTGTQTQAALRESIQVLSRTAERGRNRPRSSLHEQQTRVPSSRPRRNSRSPSSTRDPFRTRARSPSSQSRRSGVSERDREHTSRAMSWLRDHLPGSRREERRRS